MGTGGGVYEYVYVAKTILVAILLHCKNYVSDIVSVIWLSDVLVHVVNFFWWTPRECTL